MTGTTVLPPVGPPPPAPPAPPTGQAPRVVPAGPARPAARAVALVMIVVGALVAVGTIGWSAVGAAAALSIRTSERTTAADGVDRLQLDIGAADLDVEFADVSDVELQVTGRDGADRWTLDTEGSDLVVASGEQDFGGPFGRGDEAVLRLPQRLAGMDADVVIAAGDLSLAGEFGALTLEVDAGDAHLDASATTVVVRVDAGDADLELSDVETAEFSVSAGDVTADVFGGQPRSVAVVADFADVAVTLAPGPYRLTGDAADSDLVETDLVSDESATSTIDARVSASDVSITSGR